MCSFGGIPIIHHIAVIAFLWSTPMMAQTSTGVSHDNSLAHQINRLYEKGDWELGKDLAEEQLRKEPQDSDLKMLLGKYYVHRNNYDKARLELNKALELNDQNVDAKHLLVTVETETKRYSSAICYINELLEVNPYWKGLWRTKIELYRLHGNTVEANRLRQRINQIFPEDSELKEDYLYYTEQEAVASRQLGDIDGALELSKMLIAKNPENVNHYLNAANDNLKVGDRYGALAFIERGLIRYPEHQDLIDKKAGILDEQYRYAELLVFLQQKGMQEQYNHYLQEAARYARNQESATLYGKVLADNPGNVEAFQQVFNQAMANHQYQEALSILNRHRRLRGVSRDLLAKELLVYRQMGNTSRASSLVKELFIHYPDADITQAYVSVIMAEAKDKMAEQRYVEAIVDWQEVSNYGAPDLVRVAENAIYTSQLLSGDYTAALTTMDRLILMDPQNPDLHVRRAEVYLKQENYNAAFASYENAIDLARLGRRAVYIGGFSDMAIQVVSNLNEQYRHSAALEFVVRWLDLDPQNKAALQYAVNLSHLTRDKDAMLVYAQRGLFYHPDEVFFKIKIAEIKSIDADLETYQEIYNSLHAQVAENPYHTTIINAFSEATQHYGQELIKDHQSQLALTRIDTALVYAPSNNSLKYLKGVAMESLKQFDSAYYYQAYYQPSALEVSGFKQQLKHLQYRSYRNQIGLTHLRSRPGDDYSISSVSSLEYIRFQEKNTYIGRVNYSGRVPGKGVQIQAEWLREWNEKTSTMLNAAWANQFFPSLVLNASIFREFDVLSGIQGEFGLGYRRLSNDPELAINSDNNMFNAVLGATKEFEQFRLNTRLNVFLLDNNILYNLSLNTRHYMASPRNYIMAIGSIGSSPDVDLIDYQLYNGYSVLNTMVGAGIGHLISANVSGSILGSWYHYQSSTIGLDKTYGNLYNIQIQLHVAF